jgi:uncharacterized membrane protein YdjX (TVP38/TMEM64 family)
MKPGVARFLFGLFILLFILLSAGAVFFESALSALEALVEGHTLASYTVVVGLLVLATVCAPISVMPMIPMFAMVLGPVTTGLLSIVGWTIGAGIAFCIARYLGRPILGKYMPLEKMDALLLRLGSRATFLGIVALRLTMPVDLVSYALGLSRTLPFGTFILATFIGVSWFSFAFAYLGEALFRSDWLLLSVIGVPSLLVFLGSWYMLWRRR